MESEGDRLFLSVAEVAELLGVPRDTIYARVLSGEWPHTRLSPSRVGFTHEQLHKIRAELGQPVRPARAPRWRKG